MIDLIIFNFILVTLLVTKFKAIISSNLPKPLTLVASLFLSLILWNGEKNMPKGLIILHIWVMDWDILLDDSITTHCRFAFQILKSEVFHASPMCKRNQHHQPCCPLYCTNHNKAVFVTTSHRDLSSLLPRLSISKWRFRLWFLIILRN